MIESEYRKTLDRLIRTAHESSNHITEEVYHGIMDPLEMSDKEDELTRGYLKGINIAIGDGAEYTEPEFTEEDGRYVGMYLDEIRGLPVYTEEEILDAKQRAIKDDDEEAQGILMNHYLRSVVDIAKLYVYQALPAEDLIGEGNIGMMTAIRALSTLEDASEADGFVGRFIMDAMDAAVYEDTDIRQRMEDMVGHINEINDRAREMSEAMHRPVTAAELAEETGIDPEEIKGAMRLTGSQIEGLVP